MMRALLALLLIKLAFSRTALRSIGHAVLCTLLGILVSVLLIRFFF